MVTHGWRDLTTPRCTCLLRVTPFIAGYAHRLNSRLIVSNHRCTPLATRFQSFRRDSQLRVSSHRWLRKTPRRWLFISRSRRSSLRRHSVPTKNFPPLIFPIHRWQFYPSLFSTAQLGPLHCVTSLSIAGMALPLVADRYFATLATLRWSLQRHSDYR